MILDNIMKLININNHMSYVAGNEENVEYKKCGKDDGMSCNSKFVFKKYIKMLY